jgi:hypothetical protein
MNAPEPWDRHRREFVRLRWWLELLLAANIAVALVNASVQLRMACQ